MTQDGPAARRETIAPMPVTGHAAGTRSETDAPADALERATGAEHAPVGGPSEPGVWRNPLAVPCVLGFATAIAFQAAQDIATARIIGRLALAPSGLFVTAMRLIQIALLVALALLATRITRLGDHRSAVVGTGALCLALSCVLYAMLATSADAVAIHVVLSMLKAAAPLLLWLLWAELFAHLDERHVLPYYLAAAAVSGCLTLALSRVPIAAAPAVCAAVAAASLALFAIARHRLASAPFARGELPASTWSFPTTIVVLQAVFAFANVLARNTLPAEDRAFVASGVIACLGVLLAAALMPRGRHLRVRTLCDVAFPLTLGGLLGLTVGEGAWGLVAPAAAYGGEALFGAYVVVTLCAIAFRSGVNALVLFGFVQAAASLGGLGATSAIDALPAAGTPTVANAIGPVAACAAVALAVCYVVLSRERGGEVTWGVAREGTSARRRLSLVTRAVGRMSGVDVSARTGSAGDDAQAAWAGRAQAQTTAQPVDPLADIVAVGGHAVSRDALLAVCAQVAYEFGMTRREEQVLALLCRGMTAAQIEEALFVSNSTVKTHTHAVYQKLGIHGRQDVIAYMATRLDARAERAGS